MKLEINFGALVPKLADQLRAAGLSMDRETLDHYQRDVDAITRLSIRGILPEGAVRAARKRIVKRMAAKARRG